MIFKKDNIVNLEDINFIAGIEQVFIFYTLVTNGIPLKNGVGIWKIFSNKNLNSPILIKRYYLNGENEFTFKLESQETLGLNGKFVHKLIIEEKDFMAVGKINIYDKTK